MTRLSSDDSLIGIQLGDYVLTRLLAKGGMARIFEGVDHKLSRHAAVKVLDAERLADDVTLSQRFQREARAIARLEHPNIIPIYQYGEQHGVNFLAMKLIRGKDLAQELHRLRQSGERMAVGQALHILEQIAAALDAAHNANIIHRDVKPSNVLLDQNNCAILTDFGLVFQPSVDTTSGASFGTPRYISPEQAMASSSALPQSDLYSLGVIAYQILVGQTPFSGESPLELALAHINTPPPPPRSINPDIPEAAEFELLKALDKDPANRHKTAGEFATALKFAYAWEGIPTAAPTLTATAEVTAASSGDELASDRTVTPILIPRPQPRFRFAPVLVAAVLLGLAAAIILLSSENALDTAQAAATGSPTPTPTVSSELPTLTSEPPTASAPVLAGSESLTLTLVYTDSAFTIVNASGLDLSVRSLRFERGEDRYSGESIIRQLLPAGTCFRLQLQGRQSQLPPGCGDLHAETQLPDPSRFFWRSQPESAEEFDVYYDGQWIIACPTAARGSDNICELTLIVPPAA